MLAPLSQPCSDGTTKTEVGSTVSVQYCDGNTYSKVEMGLTSTTGDTSLPLFLRQSSHLVAQRNDANVGRGGGASSCGGKQVVPLLPLADLPTHVPAMMIRSKQSTVSHTERAEFVSAKEGGGGSCAARLVVSLACATTPTMWLGRLLEGNTFTQIVATAKLVLSLLPPGLTEDADDMDVEVGLVAVLRAFSCAGVLSWIRAFTASGLTASGSHEPSMPAAQVSSQEGGCSSEMMPTASPQVDISKPKPSADAMRAERRAENDKGEATMGAGNFVSSEELDSIGVNLLLRCTSACIRSGYPCGSSADVLSDRSHASGCDASFQETRMRSCPHRKRVSIISRLTLERTWLIRLLLRRISGGLRLDRSLWSSSLSTHIIMQVAEFCGQFIKTFMFDTCSPKSDFLGSSDDSVLCTREGCSEFPHHGCTEESGAALLLAAPVVINLTALLVNVLRFSTAWGEDVVWAAATCRSMALSEPGNVGVISVLVELLNGLTTVLLTIDNSDCHATAPAGKRTTTECGDETGAGREHGQSCRGASTETRDLARMMSGGVAALVELLVQVLESIRAVLCRSATMLNTSRSNGPFPADNVGSSTASREGATSIVRGASEKATERRSDESTREEKLQILEDTQDESVSNKPMHIIVEEVVSQVLRAVSPLLQPGGCVFALLNPQFVSTAAPKDCHHKCSPVREQTTSMATAEAVVAQVTLASNIRLAADFFSLCSECDFNCEGLRLERYAKPLFSGFVTYLDRSSDIEPDGEDNVQKVIFRL